MEALLASESSNSSSGDEEFYNNRLMMALKQVSESSQPRHLINIHEKLGEGAFGSVFRATLKPTPTVNTSEQLAEEEEASPPLQLAVKEVLIGSKSNDDLAKIEKEIEMLKRVCHHPNTVQYFGCLPVDDSIWILTDYCAAGSIADCIALTGSTFSEAQIALVMASAVQGLSFLHSNGIIHRDVKAANILLTQDATVKIADFGVSEKLTESVCMRNSIVGTPYWMSPEVITGQDYSYSADLWSLGITAIEMTQGVPPHADLHPMRAMFKIPFLPPPTLAHPEFYSIAFQQFLSRILVKDPVRRATALQLQTDLFISKFGVNGGGEGGNSNLNNHKLSQKEEVDMRYPLLLKVWEVMQRREELKQRKLAKLRQYQAQQELHQQHHQQKFDIVVKSRRRVGGGEGGKGKMPDVVPSGLFPMDTSTSLPLSTLLPSSASSSSSSSSSVIIASTFDPAMDSIDSIRLDAEEKQLEDNSRLVGTSIAPARKRLFHDHDNASFDSSLAAQNSVLDFGIATGYEGGGGGGGGSEGEGYAHDLDRQLHHHQRYLLDSPDALLSNCFNTTSSVTSEQSVITVKRLAATKNSATTQIVPINTPNDFDSVVVYHDQPHQLVNVDLLSGSGGGKGDKRGTSTSPGATQRTPSLAMKKSKSSSSSSSLVSTSSSSDRLSVIMAPPHHPPPSPPSSANNLHHDSEEKAIGGISPLRIFKTTTTTGTINGATSGINSLFGGGGGGGGGRRKSHQSILSTTTSTTTSSLHEDHHHHHSSPVIPSGLMNPFQKTIFGKNVAIRLRNRLQRFKQRMAGLIVMDHLDDTEDEEEEEDEGVSADEDGRFGTIVPHGRRQTSHHHGRRNQNGKKVAVEMVDKCVQADEEDTDGSTPIMRTCSLASSSSSSTSPPTPITTENDSAVEDLSRPISPMSTTPKPSPFITTSTSSSPRPPSSKYPLGDTFESLFSPNKPLYPHQHQNHDQAVASRDRTIAMMHFAYISVIILVLVIQY